MDGQGRVSEDVDGRTGRVSEDVAQHLKIAKGGRSYYPLNPQFHVLLDLLVGFERLSMV